MDKFIIVETQERPDGEVNVETTTRTTVASALSYFCERKSKMLLNTTFVRVSLSCTDKYFNEIVPHETIETQYVAPTE